MGDPEQIEFRVEDTADVVARMAALATEGRGLVNLEPEVDPEWQAPPRSVLSSLFTSRGPDAPLCTWKPGAPLRGGGRAPAAVGVQHASGPRAAAQLDVPPGWRVTQDHSRRGIVVLVPPDEDPAGVLRWLLEAGTSLSAVPLTGWWRASVYADG